MVTFVLLYFVIKLVIKFVRAPLSAVTSLPILKQANKLGGAVIGAAMGFLWLYVFNRADCGICRFPTRLRRLRTRFQNRRLWDFFV
ncbi:MAG: CvpA family protein [Clostridiales bacterium]|nr:MAG: CvpA family protein [Clostridiales bacterium]